MVIKKSVKNLISMFLERNAVTQPFSSRVCVCVCLGSFFTLIGVDLPECLIAPFLATVSLRGNWVG